MKNKIGKRRFTDDELYSNLDAVMRSIIAKRPPSVKGKYFNKAYLKTSMGPSLRLDLARYQELATPEL
jgi:large subunit ribosomal protein L1